MMETRDEAETTAIEIPKGYMQDQQGRLVPKSKIKPVDRERDRLVRDLVKRAQTVGTGLRGFKDESMAAVKAFVEHSAAEYGAGRGGRKGNMTLTSYDGSYKVVIAVHEYIAFNERLQVAKELVDNCIRRWAKGSRAEIKVLVEDAFEVDKQGRVNTKRILGLRRLDIDDEEWKSAMSAVSSSMEVAVSREYIRFYRQGPLGNYIQVPLDIAAL